MLTNDELFILGIKTRMQDLDAKFSAQATTINDLRINNKIELNALLELQLEHTQLEFKLHQLEEVTKV